MNDNLFQHVLNKCLTQFNQNTAIEYGEIKITYEELSRRADVVTMWIINNGIKPKTFVGLLIDDRCDLIISLIGVLKAGCVIVPLYPGYPTERIVSMIQTTDIQYLLIDERNFSRLETAGVHVEQEIDFVFIKNIFAGADQPKSMESARVSYSPEDPLYIHFTSGTTGIPRAIVGKNKSLLHFIKWEIDTFNLDSSCHAAQFTIPGFDPFLRDVFAPLLCGGVVCIPVETSVLLDPEPLKKWLDRYGISLIHCVSSLFRLLNKNELTNETFKELKCILLAGEKINPADLVYWYSVFGERIQLANCYGPTETTMSKAYYLIRASDIHRERIPVGKPIRGARIIILDKDMNICEPLVPGEIYIRTPFMSCGYYNNPGLNREKFIRNPYSDNPNDLLYRSGDLGMILLDGNIDILGRVDRQVKVRGYRVELEEIEGELTRIPEISEAVVLKKQITADELLCAYITTEEKSQRRISVTHIKEYLSRKLPDYMVPSFIIIIEKIPRKPTGKVDFDALPHPGQDREEEYVPPADNLEKKMVELWSQVLTVKKISVTDRFFDLGGSSLNVMTLIAKIHKTLDVKISLADIFKNSTIRKQAQLIKISKRDEYTGIEPVEKKEYYPLSSAQKRMYILQQREPGSISYNLPKIVVLRGEFPRETFDGIFKKLIKRNESLRTSFILITKEPIQRVHEEVDFEIENYGQGTTDGTLPRRDNHSDIESHQETAKIIKNFIRPFDLSRAPLLRVGLIKVNEKKHILTVDMHHIISDRISLNLFISECVKLFHRKEMPLPRLQYKDFSQWQNRLSCSDEMKKQENYWLKRFTGEIPRLDIPAFADYPQGKEKIALGEKVHAEIGKELTQKVKHLVSETETTIHIILLTVYYILLSKYTGQDDIVVGSDIVGRRHEHLENIVGMFVNMLAMRNQPRENKTFGQFLEEVKVNTLEAYENQEYQFDELVKKLQLHTNPNRNPLFDVVFQYNPNDAGKKAPGTFEKERLLKVVPYRFEFHQSHFDLLFEAITGNEGIYLGLTYSPALFKKSTAQNLMKHYIEILEQSTENRYIRLKDITISHDLRELKTNILQNEQQEFLF